MPALSCVRRSWFAPAQLLPRDRSYQGKPNTPFFFIPRVFFFFYSSRGLTALLTSIAARAGPVEPDHVGHRDHR